VVGGWRRLHNEELHNLYTSRNVIRVIKSRRIRWVAHVALMGDMINSHIILVGKPEEKAPFIRPWRRWENISRVRCGLAASGSGQGPMASCCEHGNEPSGSIKGD
jgi:hypothetical protein